MCGIAGWAGTREATEAESRVAAVVAAMRHRGPDSFGQRSFTGARNATIGAVRLRIIGATAEGDQPIANEDGTVWVVFNGELYNYRELRAILERKGHRFTTATDTECLVHLYEECRGRPSDMLVQLRGMFAFAVWDTREESLFVARDRLGIKPLFWVHHAGGVAFGSEARTLAHSGFASKEPNHAALGSYLALGAVHGPSTIFGDIEKLPPGHYLVWNGGQPRIERWWHPELVDDWQLDDHEFALIELRSVLVDSVARHLVAERPVGVFLSSGTDSSVVAAMAAAEGAVQTLTVTTPDVPAADEGDTAAAFAERHSLPHQRIGITGAEMAAALDSGIASMDQPSSDALNSWLVCRAASEAGLVVALAGVGGDELFAGYHTSSVVPRLARAARWLPLVPASLRASVRERAAASRPGGQLVRALETEPGLEGAYRAVRSLFSPSEVRGFGIDPALPPLAAPAGVDPIDAVMLMELTSYLPEQLLADIDSVSMAHSLEVRVPLLDDAVVGTALAIPAALKREHGKRLLADAARLGPLPPKRPFALPFDHWMHGALRPRVQEALLSDELPFGDLLDSAQRRRLWDAFDSRRVHWSRPWAVTVLRLWPALNGFTW